MGKHRRERMGGLAWLSDDDEPVVPLRQPPVAVRLTGAPVLPPDGWRGYVAASGAAAAIEADAGIEASVSVLLSDETSPTMLLAAPCLAPAECNAWVAWGEELGFEVEKHTQTTMIAHRDNGRLSVDSPDVAKLIFERVRPFLPPQLGRLKPSGCNPNIRLYRYVPGQRFGPHVDGSKVLADGSRTEFTLLLYLNDEGLEGGETLFYATHRPRPTNVALRVTPKQGACLLHAHGERCLTHEGAAVTRGVKYLLRTDVAYR